VDADNARVGVRTAKDSSHQHAGKLDIARVLRLTGHALDGVNVRPTLADYLKWRVRYGGTRPTFIRRRARCRGTRPTFIGCREIRPAFIRLKRRARYRGTRP